jgi:hypothetical protein
MFQIRIKKIVVLSKKCNRPELVKQGNDISVFYPQPADFNADSSKANPPLFEQGR